MNIAIYGSVVACSAYCGITLGRGTVVIALNKAINDNRPLDRHSQFLTDAVDLVIGRSCVVALSGVFTFGVNTYRKIYRDIEFPMWGNCYCLGVLVGVVSGIASAIWVDRKIKIKRRQYE